MTMAERDLRWLDEHGTALDVPIDDDNGHVRWMLGRLGDTASSIKAWERRRRAAEVRRDEQIIEAVRVGFNDRDVARFAKVRVGYVRELVSRRQLDPMTEGDG